MWVALCLLLTSTLAPGLQDPAQVAAELDRLAPLLERGRYAEWRDELRELLDEREGQRAVLVHLARIEEELAQSLFWEEYEAPELDSLVSGELVSWNERSGRAQLRYTPSTMGDFGSESGVRTHPLSFDGPYSIELRGPSYRGGQYLIYAGMSSGSAVVARASNQVQLFALNDEGGLEPIGKEVSNPFDRGEPFSLRMSVKSSSAAVYCDGKLVVSARRPKGPYGSFGVQGSFQELVIDGVVQPSWFQRLFDAHAEAARAKFERTFAPRIKLPKWLYEDAERPTQALELPGPPREKRDQHLKITREWIGRGDVSKGLAFVREIPDEEIEPAFRAFLMARLFEAGGKAREAGSRWEEVLEHEPEFLPAYFALAWLAFEVGEHERALEALQDLRDAYPEEPRVVDELGRILMLSGRREEARALVRDAILDSMHPYQLESIDRLLTKARRGPSWRTTYDSRSKNYHVFSDLDERTCYDAAQHLEASLRRFNIDLRRSPRGNERYRVFLFSGRAGYLEYTEGALGARHESSAGLYSPALEQLVIWNLPERAQMFRTIRHEGFHQYLDRLMPDPPRWLNEGLAEYYELAELEDGRWKMDRLHPSHVGLLVSRAQRLPSLEEFVFQNWRDWFQDQRQSYAQAWALCHFLLHSNSANQRLFDELVDSLVEGARAEDALEKAFSDELPRLQEEFDEYLRELAEELGG